jgi:hypothetical protein
VTGGLRILGEQMWRNDLKGTMGAMGAMEVSTLGPAAFVKGRK